MKKLLRISGIVVVLGLSFLYVINNPLQKIPHTILTTFGVAVPPASTGIDLTNCVSYYDGCNTCTVKDGKTEACTRMYCDTPAEPQCLEYINTTTETTGTTAIDTGIVALANPASVNCARNGGTLAIVSDSSGGQSGICNLPDGTSCEERAYMRGKCGATTTTGQSNPSTSGGAIYQSGQTTTQ